MADARRRQAEASGRRAETLAAWWLRLKGWRILAMRVRTPFGEVDIVARRGRMVAFVEVKHRATARELDDAIDHHRLRRVSAAAEALMPRFVRAQDDARIDVILLAPRRLPRHLTHVWQGD
ncbi:YraN family protein [Blastomonas sp.]|uniref:YraN family protein n=1 Tax=Blastomonas sp. TaxID=1909299 RepID=UPI00263145DA|nr:YraN family protein [Blastomonas sp.]MDM7956738.1 YraN family protein [Blastomonas sp.]